MGYGTGHDVKLNTKNWLYVKYNGINFVPVLFEENVESWNIEGDVDCKNNLRPNLLKYSVKIESLTQEDRDWLKNDGWKKGDQNTFDWEEKPKGSFWGGYTRPAIDKNGMKRTFPIELKGNIYVYGFGNREITVTIYPSDSDDIIAMFEDMMETYISEDDIKAYAEENEIGFSEAQEILYSIQNEDFDANWKI